MRAIPQNECLIPYLDMHCICAHMCHICEIADRYRANMRERVKSCSELFDYYDVLLKTPKGGGSEYLYKPLVLKPEVMRQRGIEVDMYNQIFIATDGAGMFSWNPGSQIDGYLLSDPKVQYTFGRQDFYGIPNKKAVERFNQLFLIDLNKYM
ncbi:MAG: hypothetical protein E7679_04810 [Ruminococcaceae bacterium]|nr:hypothetical protein [Oscillospiraceae bacterium]